MGCKCWEDLRWAAKGWLPSSSCTDVQLELASDQKPSQSLNSCRTLAPQLVIATLAAVLHQSIWQHQPDPSPAAPLTAMAAMACSPTATTTIPPQISRQDASQRILSGAAGLDHSSAPSAISVPFRVFAVTGIVQDASLLAQSLCSWGGRWTLALREAGLKRFPAHKQYDTSIPKLVPWTRENM